MSDNQQRLEALNTEQCYIVQAPAGSGKTQLLTQRYLTLLAGVKHPEEVLALTFTNKAVDELFERILNALKAATLPEPETEHERHTFKLAKRALEHSQKMDWQLLEQPQRLKVMTWDALSMQIVRQKKNLLTADVQIKSTWQMYDIYHQAVVNTITLIDEQQYQSVIANVLSHLDNNIDKVTSLMVTMLKKRDQWLRHITDDNTLDAGALQASLNHIIDTHTKQLNEAFSERLDDAFIAAVQTAHPDALPHTLDYWKALSYICLTDKGQWRKRLDKRQGFDPTLKAQKEQILAVIDSMHKGADDALLRGLLVETTKLPSADYDARDWRILHDMSVMLKLCAAQLQLIFDEQLTSDYIALSSEAIAALGQLDSPSDLALFLDYKINHILIDEFQDTSNTHYTLLEKLTQGWQSGEGKTLFIVGDPMQSIYSFREAQVGIFLKVVKEGVGSITLNALSLGVNFRSTGALVEGNNALFKTIFPADTSIENIERLQSLDLNNVTLGKISFSPSTAFNSNNTGSAFTLNLFVDDDNDQQQAQHILSCIQTIRTQHPDDDIAVLVKSRTHLHNIVPLLVDSGIEFEGADIQPLNKHWLVRDLLSLISVMVNLNDRLAWLSILRSPWCGLVLDDLLHISQHDDPLWHSLCDQNARSKLSADAQQRVQHLVDVMGEIIDKRGQFDLSYLVMILTQRLAMDDYLSAVQLTIKRLVIEQLMLLEHRDDFSIEQLKTALAELYTPTTTAQVKLMTIHKAKGLEFDHVFLVKLDRRPRHNDSEVVSYYENTARHFIAAPLSSSVDKNNSQTYQHIGYIKRQKQAFEQIRLLYVAMTRAKKSVQLFSGVKCDDEGEYQASANTFLHLLLAPYQQAELPLIVHPNGNEDNHHPIAAPVFERIENLTPPAVYTDNAKKDNDDMPEAIGNQSLFTDDSAKQLGTLVHRYLEHNHPPTSERIQYDLIANGVANTEINKSIKLIETMLSNTANDALGQWIFKAREHTQTEVAFAHTHHNHIKEIVVDRLFIDDGVLWIIDFKTSSMIEGERVANFSERLKRRYQNQLDDYADVIKGLYQQPIKKALYCPAVPVFIELDE